MYMYIDIGSGEIASGEISKSTRTYLPTFYLPPFIFRAEPGRTGIITSLYHRDTTHNTTLIHYTACDSTHELL